MTLPFGSLVGLMVAGPDPAISGVIERSDGPSTRVYRRNRLVRIESVDGELEQISGAEVGWTSFSAAGPIVREPYPDYSRPGSIDVGGDRPSWGRWDGTDFTRPTGPVTETEFLGRRAWAVELAPPSHKPYPLQLLVDAETGIVLRHGNADVGTWTQWSELEVGVDLPDSLFEYDGPARDRAEIMAEHEAEHEADMAARRAWLEAHGITRIGIAAVSDIMLHDWDDTGAFYASLELGDGALLRRPYTDAMWDEADALGYPHVYRWRDERWDWCVGLTSAVDDDALAAMKKRLAATT